MTSAWYVIRLMAVFFNHHEVMLAILAAFMICRLVFIGHFLGNSAQRLCHIFWTGRVMYF